MLNMSLCAPGIHSKEINRMFLVIQVSGFVKNFNIGIYSDTANMIYVKLCMAVLPIELYLSIQLSVT